MEHNTTQIRALQRRVDDRYSDLQAQPSHLGFGWRMERIAAFTDRRANDGRQENVSPRTVVVAVILAVAALAMMARLSNLI